jgi:hypothetical protein
VVGGVGFGVGLGAGGGVSHICTIQMNLEKLLTFTAIFLFFIKFQKVVTCFSRKKVRLIHEVWKSWYTRIANHTGVNDTVQPIVIIFVFAVRRSRRRSRRRSSLYKQGKV